jgi:hypothetical protein
VLPVWVVNGFMMELTSGLYYALQCRAMRMLPDESSQKILEWRAVSGGADGHGQKHRRPEDFRGKGRRASLLPG